MVYILTWNDQDYITGRRYRPLGDSWSRPMSLPAPPWSASAQSSGARCERYRSRLESTSSYHTVLLHWGDLQAPGGTLAAISTSVLSVSLTELVTVKINTTVQSPLLGYSMLRAILLALAIIRTCPHLPEFV